MKKRKIAILISGRGSNMKAIIEACKKPDFPAEVAVVVSNKKDALGLQFARLNNIETLVVDHKNFASRIDFESVLSAEIAKRNCELICLAGFMRLLSGQFVNRWKNKILNIHPSLLPQFKGADAVGDAIKAGVSESGCTVHFVVEEMDAGPIILQEKVAILPNDTKETLAARILEREHSLYPKALALVCNLNL